MGDGGCKAKNNCLASNLLQQNSTAILSHVSTFSWSPLVWRWWSVAPSDFWAFGRTSHSLLARFPCDPFGQNRAKTSLQRMYKHWIDILHPGLSDPPHAHDSSVPTTSEQKLIQRSACPQERHRSPLSADTKGHAVRPSVCGLVFWWGGSCRQSPRLLDLSSTFGLSRRHSASSC